MSVKSSKVVPFELSADFYNRKALKCLDHHDFSKALRYLKRAVDMEPANPEYLLNLSGVLSQMGRLKESVEVLQYVLKHVDPELTDCHYYLACNYVNMHQFDLAEEHVLMYLDRDPLGDYAYEAEQLLDFVCSELDWPVSSPLKNEPEDQDLDEKTMQHEKARKKMEEGSFHQAARILEELVDAYPDFLAAFNNLSLCYYYIGQFEQAKDMIETVLLKDPANIHALCNLAVLYSHHQETERLSGLLSQLKKLIPFQYDQTYKLAITLGIMGEHEAALNLFKKLARFAWKLDYQIFHYCAVAAYNLGRIKEAAKYWKLVLIQEPNSYVAHFYLEQIKSEMQLMTPIPYYYHLPFYLRNSDKNQTPQAFLHEEVRLDPLMRSSLLWALRYGDRETKLQVLQAFDWLADDEVKEALLEFIGDSSEDPLLKQKAFAVLENMGWSWMPAGEINTAGWRKNWIRVLELVKDRATEDEYERLGKGWSRFIQLQLPDMPVIRKPEAWAAALEWTMLPEGSSALRELALVYGVTVQTIQKNAKLIQSVLFGHGQ